MDVGSHHPRCKPGRLYLHLLTRLALGLLLTLVSITGLAQAVTQVLVIKSDKSQVYDQVTDQLKRQLDLGCRQVKDCRPVRISSFVANESKPTYEAYDLVITLGVKARRYAKLHLANRQTLNAMVPRELSGENMDNPGSDQATLLLDQPIPRLLGLVALCSPEMHTLGILYSEENSPLIEELKKDVAKSGMKLIARLVNDESDIGKTLSQLLQEIDVLLALPDGKIHNRGTVTNILLSSYRNRVPVIAFSAAYVKAGALGAVYSTPEEIGSHLAEIVEDFLKHGHLTFKYRYPKYFSVSLNHPVARSLNIKLPSERYLEQQLEEGEGR